MASPTHDEEDIAAFSGFGSWMSTFTPQSALPSEKHDESYPRHHLDVREVDAGHGYHELGGDSPKIGQENTHVVELPDNSWIPHPVPDAPPIPGSDYNWVPPPMPKQVTELPDNSKAPHPDPGPIPLPQPINRPDKKYTATQKLVSKKIEIVEIPDPICRVKVKGLQKAGHNGMFEETISIMRYGFLDDIARKLRDLGYKAPIGFTTEAKKPLPISVPTGPEEAAWPILVTNGRPCYDPDIGLRIHIDEPLTAFLSRIQISVKCTDSRIVVNGGDLKIAFHRTLRVPEDGRIHKLPASFGRFPVQNVASYNNKLMKTKNSSLLDIARKGGVFFPIFQREAMWLSFSASAGSEYKIRVFVGGVNIVTGKRWDDQSLPPQEGDREQDYILVPPQEHLDGIAVEKGIVRQFVAMPIGSGYSIEKQITGKEDIGGLQLEITMQKHHLELFDSRGRPIRLDEYVNHSPQSFMTPRRWGFEVGEVLSMTRTGDPDKHPYLGGKIRKLQKRTLRDIIDQDSKAEMPSSATLTALYPVTLQIKIPGTIKKHKITTPQFSPLDKIEKITKETYYKGQNLKDFSLTFNNVLPGYKTIQEVGLYDGAVVLACKKEKLSPMRPGVPSSTSGRKPASYTLTQLTLGDGSFKDGNTAYRKNPDSAQDVDGTPLHRPKEGYGAAALPFFSRPPAMAAPAMESSNTDTNLFALHGLTGRFHAHETRASAPTRSTLSVEAKEAKQPVESWAMGIAAGGRLAQQIHSDTTPSMFRMKWPFATALVSVQLLNAVVYETLTGMVCPPTPITPKQYVDAGIPWYDTYKSHVQSVYGGRGFDKIKTVSEIDSQDDIEASTSVASSQRVACTVCRKNFCDCVLRPCNHAFCAVCVKTRMVYYPTRDTSVIHCDICREVANHVLGFSAPMALPGQEDWLPDIEADVVVKSGHFGKSVAFELE